MEPAPERPQETPALTEAAAQLLSLIGPEELERCLFAETLEVVAAGGQRGDQAGGQWWAAARRAPYERAGEPVRTCLLVQAGSRSRQDGVPCSSTLKAYVTPQLETLEQEEQERLELRAHPTERRTHMVSHQHGMIVTKTLQEGEVRLSEGSLPSARWGRGHSCPVPPRGAAGSGGCHPQGRWGCGCPCGRVSPQAEPQSWSFSYSRAGLQGLLLEGASLLLLRVLARQRAVPPSLIFPAIDTEGHLCTSSYRALGIQQQAVGSAEVEVFVIERAVHTSTSISTVWHSSFLPSGYGWRSGQGHPQPCQPGRDPGGGSLALSPTGVWPSGYRSVARRWCFCRMNLCLARQVGLSPSLPSPNSPWTGRRTFSSTPGSWTERRSCKCPMLPMSSSTPSSGRCWLTSSRPCSCSSPATLSPSLPNSSLPLLASSQLGPPSPLLGLPSPSPAPRLTTLWLMGNKAASAACPGSFALGKLRHSEGRVGC
ncbi:ciliogenesis-associated TTC17-interacting protein isoform X2 [Phalacrocorax carbo]|uniref:ciliogenesis-associated TTC17-interacting protein isoform X2 n=1 Tax=Phalacrocorax carbo TaxID=9209 RepID=UPI00311917AA